MPYSAAMNRRAVHAIVWDFDNTLVDTRARNLSVTRRILRTVTGGDPDRYPTLRSQEAYDAAIHHTQNWQELYRVHFGLEPEQIAVAGGLWTEYQLADPTPTSWFDGVAEVVRALAHLPQAIVSMNTRENIREALRRADLAEAFEVVVGCEEVRSHRQKPAPDGLLMCLDHVVRGGRGFVVYVGDHPVDGECAANVNESLEGRGVELRVVSVGASYGSVTGDEPWPVGPTYRASRPAEVLEVIDSVERRAATAGAPGDRRAAADVTPLDGS